MMSEEQQPKKLSKAQKARAKKAETEKRRELNRQLDAQNSTTSKGALEKSKIGDVLAARNLRMIDIPADGDCLYSAIAHQMNLTESTSKFSGDTIRQRVADYISSNRDDFLPFLDEGDAIDFDKYCAGVKNSCRFGGRWGGDMELNAASKTLGCPIQVIHADGTPHCFGEDLKGKPLVITFHQHVYTLGEHYNSTEPI